MPLYSLFVNCEGVGHFSTQASADTPKGAVGRFLEMPALRQFLGRADGWPLDLSSADIVLFIPMEDLVNMHLCQLGRQGKYVQITIVRTVSRPDSTARF